MLSKDQQKVEQAQRDFVNAALRVESGASISESEFNSAKKQYFPQPGDTKEVIEQKRAARQTEIKALKLQAGSGAKNVPDFGRDKPAGEVFNSLPDPAQFDGRSMVDDSGTKYRSNGVKWVRQ